MKRFISVMICICVVGLVGPYVAGAQEVRIPISSLPCHIDESGSYYLTGDLTSTSYGIWLSADNVTIDLMGYSLIGPGPGGSTWSGISLNGRYNVEVRNGTIRGFNGRGITEGLQGEKHRIINVRVVENESIGIYLEGNGHLVKDCTASSNGSYGIWCMKGCTVTGNNTYDNERDGIRAPYGCTVAGNTSYDNGWSGIVCYTGCTVADNTTYYNQRYGITLSGNNLVDGNTAYNNDQSGDDYANIKSCSSCTFGLNHAP